ncbi:DUF6444 domain-containing protein [Vibrio mediterranei]
MKKQWEQVRHYEEKPNSSCYNSTKPPSSDAPILSEPC